jgi:hypothetical protein
MKQERHGELKQDKTKTKLAVRLSHVSALIASQQTNEANNEVS